MKNIIKIALVIIATLVGAGFASGKEIYSFFFIYGKEGIIGIAISSAIISFVIYKVCELCSKYKVSTYQKFCNIIASNVENNKLINSNLMNNIVDILLLITFYIMISGFSSFLNQEFGVNRIMGSIIIVLLCYIIFKKNIKGLVQVTNYLIPILIVFFIFISVKNINIIDNYNNVHKNILNTIDIPQYKGIFKSFLYAGYNCILLIPVIVPLANIVKNKGEIIYISVTTFVLIIVLIFAIYNLLLQGDLQIFNLEMPIIEIVKKYGDVYKYLYIIMIGISIFTTAISTGCGFLNNCAHTKKTNKVMSIIICATAIPLSQIPFSTLVNLLYPILGIIGLSEVWLVVKCGK